jgi:hypothetical protein
VICEAAVAVAFAAVLSPWLAVALVAVALVVGATAIVGRLHRRVVTPAGS